MDPEQELLNIPSGLEPLPIKVTNIPPNTKEVQCGTCNCNFTISVQYKGQNPVCISCRKKEFGNQRLVQNQHNRQIDHQNPYTYPCNYINPMQINPMQINPMQINPVQTNPFIQHAEFGFNHPQMQIKQDPSMFNMKTTLPVYDQIKHPTKISNKGSFRFDECIKPLVPKPINNNCDSCGQKSEMTITYKNGNIISLCESCHARQYERSQK
jgi:hypothetical protein